MRGCIWNNLPAAACLAAVAAGLLLISMPAPSSQAQQIRPRQAKRRSAMLQGQRANVPRPSRLPNAVRMERKAAKVAQKNNNALAWPLLAKMFRPGVNYEGVEVSNVSSNGMASEENVWGDTNGRVRREYAAPSQLQGDIVLTAPNQSYQYHRREGRLYAAHWPVEQGNKLARLRAQAQAGRVRIQVTGEEMIAGRDAVVVTVSALNGGESGEARRVFYLDKATGIRLRVDLYNSAGRQLSSTYMKSLTVGTTADPSRFEPRSLPEAEVFPLFPEGQPMFTSVEQARGQAGFAIVEPKQLPSGYALDGVWVFPGNARGLRGSALLRYSSGINHFSLFETMLPPRANGGKIVRPGLLRPRRAPGGWTWRAPLPDGDLNILYTGHLPDAHFQALQNAMR